MAEVTKDAIKMALNAISEEKFSKHIPLLLRRFDRGLLEAAFLHVINNFSFSSKFREKFRLNFE